MPSDDIVSRLRQTHRVGCNCVGCEAADHIERLRLEMSIPRDEYAMTWKNLLDRIDGLDIVEWIRAYANAYSPSDYSSPIAREVVVRSDKKWIQAADEIERLRAHVRALEVEIERYRLLEVTVMDLRRLLEVQDKQLEIAQRMIVQLEEKCTQGTKAPPESVSWLISSTRQACSPGAPSSSAATPEKQAT